MLDTKTGSLTLQKLHLGLLGVDADGIEALGGSHAALDVVSCQGVENAGLPSPIQAQHQDLLTVSFTLQSEGSTLTRAGGARAKLSRAGGKKGTELRAWRARRKSPRSEEAKDAAGPRRHKRTAAAMGDPWDTSRPRGQGSGAGKRGERPWPGRRRGRGRSGPTREGRRSHARRAQRAFPEPAASPAVPTRPRYLIGGGGGGCRACGQRDRAPPAGPGPEDRDRAARHGQRRPAERSGPQAGVHRRFGRGHRSGRRHRSGRGHRTPRTRTAHRERPPQPPPPAGLPVPGWEHASGGETENEPRRGRLSLVREGHGFRTPAAAPPAPTPAGFAPSLFRPAPAQQSGHCPGTRDTAPAVSRVSLSVRPELVLGFTRENA